MNAHDESFYISSELSEVVDLVIKRQQLLQHIKIVGTDEFLQDKAYHLIVDDYKAITTRLEKLIVKEKFILTIADIKKESD